MLIVGLTGGIGSGKSAAAALFAQRYGVPVIDTDLLAREVVEPGTPALTEIERTFGPEVIEPSGKLDRGEMRRRIFADPQVRSRLEAIVHPRIRTLATERIAALNAPYCLLVVPLLVEGDMRAMVDRVLVIDAPPDQQVARVMDRDGNDEALARAIVAAQAERGHRLAVADDVLANDGTLLQLEAAVAELHKHYLSLAQTRECGS